MPRNSDKFLTTLEQKLNGLVVVQPHDTDLAASVTWHFARHIRREAPTNANLPNVWNLHAAWALKQSAQVLDLACRFEPAERVSAVLETTTAAPQLVLVAQWVANAQNVAAKGNVLETLKAQLDRRQDGDAFVFTLCAADEYIDFLHQVVEVWQQGLPENGPALFLPVALTNGRSSNTPPTTLRTVSIWHGNLAVWDELGF